MQRENSKDFLTSSKNECQMKLYKKFQNMSTKGMLT